MKQLSKSRGFEFLAETLRDVGHKTVSTAISMGSLPGLEEVKQTTLKLVETLQACENNSVRCTALSRRITSILALLETHMNTNEAGLEVRRFFDKMLLCQKKLLVLETTGKMSKTSRAMQQLEVLDALEQEISADFQDATFALLLQQRSRTPTPEPQPILFPAPPAVSLEPQLSNRTRKTRDVECCLNVAQRYPRITRQELQLSTIVRRNRGRNEPGSPLVKSIASGNYRGQNVHVVQYSSRARERDALQMFLNDLSNIIHEQHPNVIEFVGASEGSSANLNHFMVFSAGNLVSRDMFLTSAHSADHMFTFLEGVKSGMECLLDHGVYLWNEIYVDHDGRPVIYPPYWDTNLSWEKSNHDVFSSLVGISQTSDFPLHTLSEILNITGSHWPDFKSAVIARSRTAYIRDYHLLHIANDLDLTIPPFLLTYYGKVPDFILAVGSIGIPYSDNGNQYGSGGCFHASVDAWTQVSSLWSCAGWEALHTHALDLWIPIVETEDDRGIGQDLRAPGPAQPILIEPMESSSHGWLSYGYFESGPAFGLGYEFAISDAELFEMSWNRFCETKLESFAHLSGEIQDFHAVKHVSVSVHCQPSSKCGLFQLYFHRRPSSLFNTEHYWGFFSDNPDPDILPCSMVKNMAVYYSIEINTIRAGDNWAYRGDRCLDVVVSRTPGTFQL